MSNSTVPSTNVFARIARLLGWGLFILGAATMLVGVFLVVGNVTGFFTTASFAGFFTTLLGGFITQGGTTVLRGNTNTGPDPHTRAARIFLLIMQSAFVIGGGAIHLGWLRDITDRTGMIDLIIIIGLGTIFWLIPSIFLFASIQMLMRQRPVQLPVSGRTTGTRTS